MPRKLSALAPDWWDYTTLDTDIIAAAAKLTPEKLLRLSRPGFKVVFRRVLMGLLQRAQQVSTVVFVSADEALGSEEGPEVKEEGPEVRKG